MKKYFILLTIIMISFAVCSFSQKPTSNLQFEKGTQKFKAVRTNHIVFGDVDQDGDPDMVCANMAFNNSKVWLNDGKGKFIDSGQELTQLGHGLGLKDLDADGDLDIFMTCAGWGDRNRVEHSKPSKVYLNNGQGAFHDSGQNLGDSLLSGNSVDLIDIDKDGDWDAYLSYYQEPDKIYLNNGKGGFKDSYLTLPENLSIVDLNDDGNLDYFIEEIGKGYQIRLNNGDAQFTNYAFVPDTTVARVFPRFEDLDLDGDIDVVLTNANRSESFPTKILFNDGSGRFTVSSQVLTPSKFGRLAIGDLNGDSYPDILITSMLTAAEIWINNGDGSFYDSQIRLSNKRSIHSPTFIDLDMDGDLDIVIANFFGGENEIWINKTN